MTFAERRKQEIRMYASASDDTLLYVFNNSSLYTPSTIAIVEKILKARGYSLPDNTPEPKQSHKALKSRNNKLSDNTLESQQSHGVLKSQNNKPPDNIPEPKHDHRVLKSQDRDTTTANYPLTDLCARWYCLMFEIGLWLLLIGGIIGGGAIGYSGAKEVGIFIGAIIGFVIAFVVTLFAGGLISVFLKLCANIEEVKRKIKNTLI